MNKKAITTKFLEHIKATAYSTQVHAHSLALEKAFSHIDEAYDEKGLERKKDILWGQLQIDINQLQNKFESDVDALYKGSSDAKIAALELVKKSFPHLFKRTKSGHCVNSTNFWDELPDDEKAKYLRDFQ